MRRDWQERAARREARAERIARKRAIAVLVVGAIALIAQHDAATAIVVGGLMAVVAALLLAGTPAGRRWSTYVATRLGIR